MLDKSFIFLDGISDSEEKLLWQSGIDSWQKFLDSDISFIPNTKKKDFDDQILQAIAELSDQNAMHFKSCLPQKDLWRIYQNFKKTALYLDIETTGLGFENDVTLVGTYHNGVYEDFVLGQNLSKQALQEKLDLASVLITFNGSQFDMPFLNKKFNLNLTIPHLDLRFLGYKVDLRGGLKTIEHNLGISRSDETTGMSGREAIYLWNDFKHNNNISALAKLRAYCKEDVMNLEKLADIIYDMLYTRTLNSKSDF